MGMTAMLALGIVGMHSERKRFNKMIERIERLLNSAKEEGEGG